STHPRTASGTRAVRRESWPSSTPPSRPACPCSCPGRRAPGLMLACTLLLTLAAGLILRLADGVSRHGRGGPDDCESQTVCEISRLEMHVGSSQRSVPSAGCSIESPY